MNCDRIQNLYTDLYEDTLNPRIKQLAMLHLGVCSTCRLDYERFQEAMRLLDEPVQQVAVPAAFRSQVLARVAIEANQSSKLPGWRSWLQLRIPVLRLAGVGAAVMAILAAAAVDLSTPTPNANQGDIVARIPAPPSVSGYSGVFQKLSASTQGDKTYHNFTIELPTGISSARVNAYVLQDARALTDESALDDKTSATLAWSDNEPLTSNVQVNIPVAVVTSAPAGSTLPFLVCSTVAGSGESVRKDLAFVPLDNSRPALAIQRGANLYLTLQTVSASQGINIVVDDAALKANARAPYAAPSGVDGSSPLSALLAGQTHLAAIQISTGTYAVVGQ
ncbi:MAG: hypothetical protein P4L33_14870 [Capsulimonadaceae bacterium]|nr:hypothetical protein [Capsulimonadaceae bacterium]